MDHAAHHESRDRARVTRVIRHVIGRLTGEETYSLTLSVALFSIGETEIPVHGERLATYVRAVADAVETQSGLAEGDVVRQRLLHDLRPFILRRGNDQRRTPDVDSGVREKVRAPDNFQRTTLRVADPLACYSRPTRPAPDGTGAEADEEDERRCAG